MKLDLRWKQRFSNFEKAMGRLREFIELPQLNKFELQGLIKCFEYTFELALKLISRSRGSIRKVPELPFKQLFRQIN